MGRMRHFAVMVMTVVALWPVRAVADEAQVGAVLAYDFDDSTGLPGKGPWTSGCFADSVRQIPACVVAHGAGLARPKGEASALEFPAPGRGAAVLRIEASEDFNPGERDFSVEAVVRLDRNERTRGENVIQKGVFDTGQGQWKMQVDGGVPSCRVSGTRTGKHVSAIAVGRHIEGLGWVRVHCGRKGGVLFLEVEGQPTVLAPADASMFIANDDPVTIGGRLPGYSDNDQFHGDVDEVRLELS